MRYFLLLIAVATLAGLYLGSQGTSANHSGDLDCGDFATQKAAQDHMNAHPGDPDGLDGNDNDGRACESRPCPCYYGGPTPPQTDPPTPSPTDAPTASPTPIPTPTAAPTSTVAPGQKRWGDGDCDGDISTRDNQALLRKVLNQSPLSQTPPCFDFGADVRAGGNSQTWGDWDCDLEVSTRDNQALLRKVLSQAALSQTQPCPVVGAGVVVEESGLGGELAIHHIDVEQGDAALIVSPGGEVAMIDTGRWTNCSNTVSYLESRGVSRIDYHFATHYDADHIGCLDDLVAAGVSVGACIDRGGSKDTETFDEYATACVGKREMASKGQVITLDASSTNPVTITVIDLNGASDSSEDENALGLVLKLTYGAFDHEFAGDLPGEDPDIESLVAEEIGDVEICKVHHHGSRFSSNETWLTATDPEVCVMSVGGNPYGHPTSEAVARLHAHGVALFWTNVGSGVSPGPMDQVCDGSVTITVALVGDYAVECR